MKRRIIKTISYRLVASLTTIFIALFAGIPIELASIVGVTELVIKPVVYYFHEKFWGEC